MQALDTTEITFQAAVSLSLATLIPKYTNYTVHDLDHFRLDYKDDNTHVLIFHFCDQTVVEFNIDVGKPLFEIVSPNRENEASIVWTTDDFESRAEQLEEDSEPLLFDRAKFQSTLHLMIRKHDATIGISWDTIDAYLQEYCKLQETH